MSFVNIFVTHGTVKVGNIEAGLETWGRTMADNSWRNLEVWERVKWARSRHFDSASAAAEALGMKEGTYRCYERGPGSAKYIPLEYKHARSFARDFKVRWEGLLDGVEKRWIDRVGVDVEHAAGRGREGVSERVQPLFREFDGARL